jgi:predicted dehydrogenase
VAERDDVDVVYVATTNDLHLQNTLDCVELGKPVLCEKPIGINAQQARTMLEAAGEAGVFVMEAMWSRFQPFVAKVDELITSGAIGEIGQVLIDFCYLAPEDASRRWMKRELGGGALLDIGIYPLSLIHHWLGSPESFEAMARLGPTGVDIETNVLSRHAGGASGVAVSSFATDGANEGIIAGSEGLIRIHSPFHHSQVVTVEREGEVLATHDVGYEGHGFKFEVAEVEKCLAEGLIESPMRPHRDTLEVMEWMDAIRARCGIEFDVD